METEPWAWVKAGLTVFAAVSVWLLMLRWNARKRLPPGPLPWPVLGNIPQLGALPHQNLAKLAKKYGPLMFLRLGSEPTLVVSSPQLAEEFLKKNDSIWASRGPCAAGKILCYDSMDIAFSEYGPRWRNSRKIFLQELLTIKRLADFKRTRKEEVMSGINRVIEECEGGTKAVRMDMPISRITLNVVTRMLMNEGILNDKADSLKNSVEFQTTIKEAFHVFGVVYIGDFIPWLDRFDIGGYKKRMRAAAKKFDEFFDMVLEDHREKHKMRLKAAEENPEAVTEDTVQDIVDTMLTRPRETDGENLDEREIKGIMEDVILAGTDTTANTLEWGLSELLKDPGVMEKAQAEMDSVVGRDRLVEESDLANLPYLHAIVKETFRLHPAGPLMAPHVSIEDSEMGGYKIPAKTRVYVNVYAIQRDPAVWDRASDFYPERFLDSKKDVLGLDFDLLPFGSGRRSCPGRGLGLLQFHYTLAVFVQTCNWRLPENLQPEDLDMDEYFGITVPRRNPLRAVAVPRLPKHVLQNFDN